MGRKVNAIIGNMRGRFRVTGYDILRRNCMGEEVNLDWWATLILCKALSEESELTSAELQQIELEATELD